MGTRLCATCLAALAPAMAGAQTCTLDFTVVVTQGVGDIRPGDEIHGQAEYTLTDRSIRQESGTTAWLASGEMRLGTDIAGPIWTLMTTAGGPTADLIGVYANHVEGLTVAGVAFEGPMALTLFGRAGTLRDPAPPTDQAAWDSLDLRRAFSLQAHGQDMLSGDVAEVMARCE
ncbi:hypothetical protein P6F26_13765 [Roseibacterium sp. SDUM158017]|uniref:hypothetical protein n=1 Tax=Roseicyclus salinarum TaxID=3036773 RepID=UPI00241545C4|nr:hypothetical protein [Roseibacterium sp. SDUM158017]MDG4649505.1 hypothetical protein [Roseibacterium sp. SDUM158017]